jgi:ABC-type multidrug transport system ATPase subunit
MRNWDVSKQFNDASYQLRWESIGKNSNISGYGFSGELFAFIGMDKNEKSNILNQIANPKKNKKIYLNHHHLDYTCENFSFLQLEDFNSMYLNLTVLESLVFSASLRIKNPSHIAELSALRLLADLGLKDIESKRTRNLPLWQRRMIFIARELIAGKDILFIDEPTADLDAPSALALITCLKRAAIGNSFYV